MAKPDTEYQGRFLSVLKRGTWEYVERVGASGVVCVVAVTKENRLVLVEQYRPPVDTTVIELPAGLAGDLSDSPDEGFEVAAKRELQEETGYVAESMDFMVDVASSAGLTSEVITMFRAKGLTKEGEGGGDESENITVHEVPVDEVMEWLKAAIARGAKVDSRVYGALWFLKTE